MPRIKSKMQTSLRCCVSLILWGFLCRAEFPDCALGPLSGTKVCDTSLPFYERAADLVDRMTLEEKLKLTNNGSPGVARLGLPPYQWWSEALHGVADSPGVHFHKDGNFSCATSFPQPISLGATFDDDLVYNTTSVISTEARAFNNFGNAGLNYWTPNINPFKDPRWGRGQETPGEDAYHVQRYVFQAINGFQGAARQNFYDKHIAPLPNTLKIIPNCKHFAGYDLEDWNGVSRHTFNAIISQQDLVEYYLPSFQTCVRDARAVSVMCSYNRVNGIPVCANSYFLQTILRDLWGFKDYFGHVTGDCDAIQDIYDTHHYKSQPHEAAAAALKAGTDSDCGSFYPPYLNIAHKKGLVLESQLDIALIRLYSALVRVGYFDPPSAQSYRQLGWADVDTPRARQLARRAAQEGIVLLKNDGILPLEKRVRRIALVGPLANATIEMQGNYRGNAPFIISPLAAAKDLGYEVGYAYGCANFGTDESKFDTALHTATKADVVIFVGGIDNENEAETLDRTSIMWPGPQLDLIRKLERVGKPIIVVQMGGGQIDDTYLRDSETIHGLLWAGYPGQSGGSAILDVLTGVYAPSGRLPVTQYPAEYVNQIKMSDMTLRPSDHHPGRTYKWYEGNAVYPFGFGLHYTQFEYCWSRSKTRNFEIDDLIQTAHTFFKATPDRTPLTDLGLEVTNTGLVLSDHVVLLFMKSNASPLPSPTKQLVGFDRINDILPRTKRSATLHVNVGSIARVDDEGNAWLFPGTYEFIAGPSTDKSITVNISLIGKPRILSYWAQNKQADHDQGLFPITENSDVMSPNFFTWQKFKTYVPNWKLI